MQLTLMTLSGRLISSHITAKQRRFNIAKKPLPLPQTKVWQQDEWQYYRLINKENLLRRANHTIIRVMSKAGERSCFLKKNLVTGHNVYKHIWTPRIGEKIPADKEPSNLQDTFAVSVVIFMYPLWTGWILKQLFPWGFLRAFDYFHLET